MQSLQKQKESDYSFHVLGPLEILAIIDPTKEGYVTKAFAKLPNGNAVCLHDQSGSEMLKDNLHVGDIVICAAAILDSNFPNPAHPHHGIFEVVEEVYLLKDGKAILLPGGGQVL